MVVDEGLGKSLQSKSDQKKNEKKLFHSEVKVMHDAEFMMHDVIHSHGLIMFGPSCILHLYLIFS